MAWYRRKVASPARSDRAEGRLKADIPEVCVCGLEEQAEIFRCPHFRYFKGKKEFVSVGRVIKTLLPPAYEGVVPAVLEHARIRGERVDAYFSEYLRSGTVTLNAGEWQEVLSYLEKLINWWDKQNLHATEVQKIVYSESDGIAGTLDIRTSDAILDIKCVFTLQSNYGLQLGGYLYMLRNGQSTPNAGVIHVTKNGVRLVDYPAAKCAEQWE